MQKRTMYLQILAGLLALSGAATAFSDASPWILLSTSEFRSHPSADQIQSSSRIVEYTKDFLAECPTDRYLVVLQPGLSVTDFRHLHGCALPHLCRLGDDSRIQGKLVVSEVVGEPANFGLSDHIKASCAREGKAVKVDELRLTSLSAEDRAGSFFENDATLAKHLRTLGHGDDSYTLVLHSVPSEPSYEADFGEAGYGEPVRMDLKRRQGATTSQQENKTDWNKLPLFKKYQFFTPGIFTAIITAIVLFSILGVGLRALGSLQVSYGAFDKEMGPAAQRKNQ